MNNASGRTAAQVGLIDGYNTTSGNFGDNLYHNYNEVEAGRIRANADSGNYLKYHVWQQLTALNLEPNTQYTFSVYAKTNRNPPSTNSYFNFWFHDDAQGTNTGYWRDSWSTDFDNAQKSPNMYLTTQWKRYHYTFTTDATANLIDDLRVGFVPRYDDNNSMWFWGAQLEKGQSPTPYVYTQSMSYPNTATVTGTWDPRQTELAVGQLATYTVTYTINQSALDVAKKLHNSVKFVGTFTTNSGITASVSATSDDPNTAAANDDTITDLDNESGIEVTKTYVVDQGADNLTNLGDVITWQVKMENKGQTSLSSFTFDDTLTRWDSSTASSSFSTIQPGSKNLLEHTTAMTND